MRRVLVKCLGEIFFETESLPPFDEMSRHLNFSFSTSKNLSEESIIFCFQRRPSESLDAFL